MINHPFVDSRFEVAPRLEANKQDSLEAYVDSKIMYNLRCLCFQIPGKSPNTGLNGTGTNSLNQITPGTPPTGDSRAPAAQQKQVPSPTHFLAADSGQKKWHRWIQKKWVVFSNHPDFFIRDDMDSNIFQLSTGSHQMPLNQADEGPKIPFIFGECLSDSPVPISRLELSPMD